MIQRSGDSPILQNQEQEPDQKKVLPDSGLLLTPKLLFKQKLLTHLFQQDHLLSEENVNDILMEYIFGKLSISCVIHRKNPKDGTKIQLNLFLSPEGESHLLF